jgi:ornithine cyclodeaminase
VLRARVFVDSRVAAWSEAGDLLIPRAEGVLDEEHIEADLGELLCGEHPGRRSPQDITVFESLGLAVEDLAAAHWVWQRALETGRGTVVDLGGQRDAPVT